VKTITAPSSSDRIPDARWRTWTVLIALLAAGPVCYGLGLWAASMADGRAMSDTVCFNPDTASHYAPIRLLMAMVMAVGAIVFLFGVPWLLGMLAIARTQSKHRSAGAWSVIVNSTAIVLACLMLRHTAGVNRGSFFAVWLAWNAILAAWAGKPAKTVAEIRALALRWGPGMLIGAVVVATGIVAFRREHFVQCFNGDGTETYELARSLQHHFLPHWEIEPVEQFGAVIVNPSLINSYATCSLQLLLGRSEPATRLLFWVWWFGVFAVALTMVLPDDARAGWLPAIPFALLVFLVGIWYTFYVGYYPYMADPANPGVPDALFTLVLLLAWDCLRRGDGTGWAVSMILASLIFYAGVVIFVLTAAAALVWRPLPRRRMLWATLLATIGLSVVAGGYLATAWVNGLLPGWWSTLHREVFRKYSSPGAGGDLRLWFVGYFVLGCGVIPAIALVRAFWKKVFWKKVFWKKVAHCEQAWDRSIAAVTLVYLLIILGSGHKNLHYLGPLLPIPLILWLRQCRSVAPNAKAQWGGPLLAAGGLTLAIVVSWPPSRPIFTLNRELGAVTTFETDSYEEACRWGRIAGDLYRQGHLGWRIGEHTWAGYSQWAARPLEPRPLLITDGADPPSQYKLVYEADNGVKLYSRDTVVCEWAAGQRPPAGAARCPAIFRPIAVTPRP